MEAYTLLRNLQLKDNLEIRSDTGFREMTKLEQVIGLLVVEAFRGNISSVERDVHNAKFQITQEQEALKKLGYDGKDRNGRGSVVYDISSEEMLDDITRNVTESGQGSRFVPSLKDGKLLAAKFQKEAEQRHSLAIRAFHQHDKTPNLDPHKEGWVWPYTDEAFLADEFVLEKIDAIKNDCVLKGLNDGSSFASFGGAEMAGKVNRQKLEDLYVDVDIKGINYQGQGYDTNTGKRGLLYVLRCVNNYFLFDERAFWISKVKKFGLRRLLGEANKMLSKQYNPSRILEVEDLKRDRYDLEVMRRMEASNTLPAFQDNPNVINTFPVETASRREKNVVMFQSSDLQRYFVGMDNLSKNVFMRSEAMKAKLLPWLVSPDSIATMDFDTRNSTSESAIEDQNVNSLSFALGADSVEASNAALRQYNRELAGLARQQDLDSISYAMS